MAAIKLSELNYEEKEQFYKETREGDAGSGIVYDTKYHTLMYRPMDDNKTGKCIGLELIVTKKPTTNHPSDYIPGESIAYKQSLFTIDREPFKIRLDRAVRKYIELVNNVDQSIDNEIAKIAKAKSDREQAIRNHTEHVKSCHLKIDSAIKAIVPTAKPMLEINNERLLAEAVQKEADEKAISSQFSDQSSDDKFNFSPVHTGGCYEDDFSKMMSDQERQWAINDAILNVKKDVKKKLNVKIDKKKKFGKYGCDGISRFEFSVDSVNVEVICPEDPKYKTNLEKQEQDRNIRLMNPNIMQ